MQVTRSTQLQQGSIRIRVRVSSLVNKMSGYFIMSGAIFFRFNFEKYSKLLPRVTNCNYYSVLFLLLLLGACDFIGF